MTAPEEPFGPLEIPAVRAYAAQIAEETAAAMTPEHVTGQLGILLAVGELPVGGNVEGEYPFDDAQRLAQEGSEED